MSIEKIKNYDDTFLRDVIVAFLAQLHNRIKWDNIWDNERRTIEVPFYYSMTGDDRFLLDAFVDDIPGRRIEQNYDAIPRGIVTLESTTVHSTEFTNPNVKVSRFVELDAELKRVVSTMRTLPMTLGFDIKIKVASEQDVFKCHQAIWNLIYQYQYFYFEHKFLRFDAAFKVPDEFQTRIGRETNMTSEIYMDHNFRLDVHTYYPLFGEIEQIAPINKVQWQNNIWRLKNSGAENSEPKNMYPPDSEKRTSQNRSDKL